MLGSNRAGEVVPRFPQTLIKCLPSVELCLVMEAVLKETQLLTLSSSDKSRQEIYR